MERRVRNRKKADRLDRLSETSRGTLMGTLLRQFWQPVAISEKLAKGTARALRVMGEDLTLYRGESGTPHLVAGRCAHRGTVLHTGWVEGDQIRCMYHGWCYDGAGVCTDIPAERRRPRTETVKIVSYPLHEYAGLIFAYLGDAPAPAFELPRKPALEKPGQYLWVREQMWDCNWFQQIENSLDSTHVSFVHVWGRMSRFGDEIQTAIPELSYEETNAGIRQTAVRGKNNVRISDWTFPNNNHVVSPGPQKGDPWYDIVVWAVPIDDEHTMRFHIGALPSQGDESNRRIAEEQERDYDPSHHYDELFRQNKIPPGGAMQILTTQDYVAQRGQGIIADRSNENLSPSDAGVVFLRKIFLRELDAIHRSKPTKAWAPLAEKIELPISIPEKPRPDRSPPNLPSTGATPAHRSLKSGASTTRLQED